MILEKACESGSGRNHSKRWENLQFGCLEERDEKHFSWQAQRIVDLKAEKNDFAAQCRVLKVTCLRHREVLNSAVTLGFVMQSVCPEVRFCEKSRVKRSFCKFGLSLLVKVVLEAWIVSFGESLVENAGLKLGLSLLVRVSWNTLVLEAWIVTFGESLVGHARFGSLDTFGESLVENARFRSLDAFGEITFGESLVENACFGSLECHFSWESRDVHQECPAASASSSKSVLKRV